MINFEDLHELALKLSKEPPITEENIYVDLLLTMTISEIQADFDFVLKGGTAIVKTWFSPYRFSYDLDFSIYAKGNPRKQYRKFQKKLEEKASELGFTITNEENDKHREGGRIFILKIMDKPEYLRIPAKLSVSALDDEVCFSPLVRSFKPVVEISEKEYGLLYPDVIPKVNNVNANILTIEELCAEKIRALATRGHGEEWSFILRDVVDLYVMEKNDVLDKVLTQGKYQNCLRKKFMRIHGTSYWKKFKNFMSAAPDVKVREEDLSIFLDQNIIDEEKVSHVMEKVRSALDKIIER